jgi:hypothetical protein
MFFTAKDASLLPYRWHYGSERFIRLVPDVFQKVEKILNFVAFGRRVIVRRIGKTWTFDLEAGKTVISLIDAPDFVMQCGRLSVIRANVVEPD